MSDREDLRDPMGSVRAAVLSALREDTSGIEALAQLCRGCVDLVPVDGASVSLMSDSMHQQMLYASDDVSARIEALQFSLGEGPCFEAFDTRGPVLVPDLKETTTRMWPVFASEASALPAGAIFAFPLQSGAIRLGAIDLYRARPGGLVPAELTVALEIVELATLVLLGARTGGADDSLAAMPRGRERVHQATGMLLVALDVSAEQALALLRGHAFAAGRLVDDVARDLVERRISPSELGN
jgi:hypothetical protein